jgi:hypothetical protein
MTKEEKIETIKKDINKKTALIFSLADIQEGLVVDIISKLKNSDLYHFDVKHSINAIQKQTEKFRAELNRAYKTTPEKKEEFGEVTDELKEIIFKILNIS